MTYGHKSGIFVCGSKCHMYAGTQARAQEVWVSTPLVLEFLMVVGSRVLWENSKLS